MYLLGIRPSGTKGIHLGHYIGVFSVAKKLDNVNILIADLYEDCTNVELSMKQIQQLLPNANLILQKWFLAIALILNAKKGISTRQLARDLELPVKTAWSVGMRIRKAFKSEEKEILKGIFENEVHENYFS